MIRTILFYIIPLILPFVVYGLYLYFDAKAGGDKSWSRNSIAISMVVGLLLMAGVYISVGVLASSITDNQIIAFILGFLFVFFFFILDKILFYIPGFLTGIVEYLGTDYHFSNIARGVIDSRDIIYFLTLLGFMLYLSVVSLERRKW